MTAQPGLHSLYRTGSGGATATLTNGRTGLVLFAVTRLAARFTDRLRRPADRVVCVARIAFALTRRLLVRRRVSHFSTSGTYFLRSTMCLSVRLLFRVFFPNVGKAHGVCG